MLLIAGFPLVSTDNPSYSVDLNKGNISAKDRNLRHMFCYKDTAGISQVPVRAEVFLKGVRARHSQITEMLV